MVHPKRHAMEMEFTTACDEKGRLTAMKATVISDTGAYASFAQLRSHTHGQDHITIRILILQELLFTPTIHQQEPLEDLSYTDSFATECNLNKLAEMVGISPGR